MTFNEKTARKHQFGMQQSHTGYTQPRDDLRPEERCYIAFDEAKVIIGFVQEFADGTAASWKRSGDVGKPASGIPEAMSTLLASREF